ncbi:hypothetical protein D3C87_1886570 [compost metagenome]
MPAHSIGDNPEGITVARRADPDRILIDGTYPANVAGMNCSDQISSPQLLHMFGAQLSACGRNIMALLTADRNIHAVVSQNTLKLKDIIA